MLYATSASCIRHAFALDAGEPLVLHRPFMVKLNDCTSYRICAMLPWNSLILDRLPHIQMSFWILLFPWWLCLQTSLAFPTAFPLAGTASSPSIALAAFRRRPRGKYFELEVLRTREGGGRTRGGGFCVCWDQRWIIVIPGFLGTGAPMGPLESMFFCSFFYRFPKQIQCERRLSYTYQDPPTGCLETLTGGFWAPVATRKHL